MRLMCVLFPWGQNSSLQRKPLTDWPLPLLLTFFGLGLSGCSVFALFLYSDYVKYPFYSFNELFRTFVKAVKMFFGVFLPLPALQRILSSIFVFFLLQQQTFCAV